MVIINTGDVLVTTHADVVLRVYVVLLITILQEVRAELERDTVEGNVIIILPFCGIILVVVKVRL
jgi:hypothetical protein